ncbi:DUF6299 family protein [Sorangium sp. So ce1389]|uniref:DUF6299 family protein n=1 Tax=Sorangium sp. So ce1389 TaxID=3133336 RepID=UPI003F61C733
MSMYRRFRFVPLAFVSLAAMAGVALAEINSFTITDAELTAPGVVTVTGTITCPAGGSWFVSANVSQNTHGQAQGGTGVFGTCTGSQLTWTTEVTSFTAVPFKHGRAFVSAFAQACTFFCENETETANESL